MKTSEVTQEDGHQFQEHDSQQLASYQELQKLVLQPDLFNETTTQEAFVNKV